MQQPAGRPPTMRERWAALAGQQQATIVLATVAVILMIIILLVLLTGSQDDDDVGVVVTSTSTPTIIEVTSTPDPSATETAIPEPEPTNTPEPEPTETPEPEPTETPEPEPTETPEPEPTETLEPEPTATPEPEPTATPEPEPTATPEPISGEIRVEDPENDVRSPEGEQPPAALPFIDLRAVELNLDGDDLEIKFVANDDIPEAIDPGVIVTWTLVIWIDDVENYRVVTELDGDEWTITVIDVTSSEEFIVDKDEDIDEEELTIEIPRALLERLTGPFTWAAMAMIQTADEQLFGDNLPDAGDFFNEESEPDEREAFPQ